MTMTGSGPGTRPTCDWDGYNELPNGAEVYWHCEDEAVGKVKTLIGTLEVCGHHLAEALDHGGTEVR
jgi:hypothetical protein